MDVGSQITGGPFQAARQKINRLIEEAARLAETDVPAEEFFGPFLERVVAGINASAAALWRCAEAGNLRLEHQIHWHDLGIDNREADHTGHDELLQQAVRLARPVHMPPNSRLAESGPGRDAINPTEDDLLIAPIGLDGRIAGLLEVWVDSKRDPNAIPGYLQFLATMADLSSTYLRYGQVRQLTSQSELWTQLEAFARDIHSSLEPTRVAYRVANQGRRLIGCDRLSVALAVDDRIAVTAVSGADLVERQSNLVRRMKCLFERVLNWNETLVFHGDRDGTLPSDVLAALDAYLSESPSKVLAILPLRDERDASRKPARSALMMESFELAVSLDQMTSRLEVVGRQAASALYNASEYDRIPLGWLWKPAAAVQRGLGGKTRATVWGVVLALAALVGVLVFVPAPLKMEAKGTLLPEERRWLYAPVEGQVVRFEDDVLPGSSVAENQALVLMYDMQLEIKLTQLENEIVAAQQAVEALARQENGAPSEADRLRASSEKKQKELSRDRKILERSALRERTHAEESSPGNFWLTAPMAGTILNRDFRENLTHRHVKPSEPLLRIGDKKKNWEVELKISQKQIGAVLEAFAENDPRLELDVDLMPLGAPARIFRGKLARERLGSQATPNRDDPLNPESVITAFVRVDGPGIEEDERLAVDFRVAGAEVRAKIRCGDRALGYALFHGLWDFVYERVVFFF